MAVAAMRAWTLEDLDRLPDDGNTYEVVRGELFVTPAPSRQHQRIIARLARILHPYVDEQQLGLVHQARSVVRRKGSETEPDLFVSQDHGEQDWAAAPTPSLVVEVFSLTTWRRDLDQKRKYYLEDVGVPVYWMVDPRERRVTVARPDTQDLVVDGLLTWEPAGATRPLIVDLTALFV